MGFLLDELNAYEAGIRASERQMFVGCAPKKDKEEEKERKRNKRIFKEFELVIKNPENRIEYLPRETVADPYCPDKKMSLGSTYKIREKTSNKLIFQISYIFEKPYYALLPRIEGFYPGNYDTALMEIFFCAADEYAKTGPQRCIEDKNTVHNFLKQYQVANNKQK